MSRTPTDPAPSLLDTAPFDPRMVTVLAAEVGDPTDIAASFGVPASEFAVLQESSAFKVALERARTELREQGYSPEYAEMVLLQEALPGMVKDLICKYHAPNTTIEQRLKIVEFAERTLAERRKHIGPKREREDAGTAFSVTIVLPELQGLGYQADGNTITVEAAK